MEMKHEKSEKLNRDIAGFGRLLEEIKALNKNSIIFAARIEAVFNDTKLEESHILTTKRADGVVDKTEAKRVERDIKEARNVLKEAKFSEFDTHIQEKYLDIINTMITDSTEVLESLSKIPTDVRDNNTRNQAIKDFKSIIKSSQYQSLLSTAKEVALYSTEMNNFFKNYNQEKSMGDVASYPAFAMQFITRMGILSSQLSETQLKITTYAKEENASYQKQEEENLKDLQEINENLKAFCDFTNKSLNNKESRKVYVATEFLLNDLIRSLSEIRNPNNAPLLGFSKAKIPGVKTSKDFAGHLKGIMEKNPPISQSIRPIISELESTYKKIKKGTPFFQGGSNSATLIEEQLKHIIKNLKKQDPRHFNKLELFITKNSIHVKGLDDVIKELTVFENQYKNMSQGEKFSTVWSDDLGEESKENGEMDTIRGLKT